MCFLQGATVAEMVGANITRTYTCGKEGRSIKTTFWDLQDPSAELGALRCAVCGGATSSP